MHFHTQVLSFFFYFIFSSLHPFEKYNLTNPYSFCTVGSVAFSHLQVLPLDPELRLLSVWNFCACGFPLGFLPPPQKHDGRRIGESKTPQGVNNCVNVCGPVMAWWPMRCTFPCHTVFSEIKHKDKDEAVIQLKIYLYPFEL